MLAAAELVLAPDPGGLPRLGVGGVLTATGSFTGELVPKIEYILLLSFT